MPVRCAAVAKKTTSEGCRPSKAASRVSAAAAAASCVDSLSEQATA